MERCPSWPKEHDWKSCVRLKRTVGSNPTLSATEKEPERLFFCGGESGITHLCIFKCTGCASLRRECANLMSRTKAIVWKEVNIKNKVRAGIEVVANDPTHLINPSSRFGGSVLSAKPRPKEPERLFFCGGESGITHKFFLLILFALFNL